MKILRLLLPFVVLIAIGLSSRWLPHRAAPITVKTERMDHGRFKRLTVYAPADTPKNFVLFLSGPRGWNAAMAQMAVQLAQREALVVGIDLPQLQSDFEADAVQCVFADGDLENLSHFVQAYYRLPTYLEPLLVGYADGGALAYATLVQAPKQTFAAALSIGFCPVFNMHKPLCSGSGIESKPTPDDKGVEFLPATRLTAPWLIVKAETGAACPAGNVDAFIAQVAGAKIIASSVGDTSAFLTAFGQLAARNPGAVLAVPPAQLSDLPIVAVPAATTAPPSDTFAILLSGDGGWAGLDHDVAAALSSSGIAVIGLDSLRYFWSARTPEGLAADLDRMIRYYLTALHKKHVLLIGYSQGADVLPFGVNRLHPDTRASVSLTAVMGMSEHALFEFHLTSWVSDDNSGPATRPEVNRIQGLPVICIYGDGETDSLCPTLDPQRVDIVKLKGGHHFDGDYASLARAILDAAHAGLRGGDASVTPP